MNEVMRISVAGYIKKGNPDITAKDINISDNINIANATNGILAFKSGKMNFKHIPEDMLNAQTPSKR